MREKIRHLTAPGEKPRIISTERDCPRCDAVLVENCKEDCFECLKCGYINCGEERDIKS